MWRDPAALLRSLRGLLDVAPRALDDDLPGALQNVVDHLAQALDVRGVAINLLRPAWDDFEVVAVHAPPDVARALEGGRVPRSTIDSLLAPRFDVGGAFFVPAGSFEEELPGTHAIISRDDRGDSPDAWHEQDELLVPIRGSGGELSGFISIDEPASGLRPGPAEIELAVVIADAASAAVQTAQRALEHRRNEQALERLFEVSAGLASAGDVDAILTRCCEGVRDALGFERVLIETVGTGPNDLQVRAAVGWTEPGPGAPSTIEQIEALADPDFEVEGCYLLPFDAAVARGGLLSQRYSSVRNGEGPRAWNHHWLVVPLRDPSGRTIGLLWPDDPADRLLPTPDRMRILRTFANQAAAAISAAANLERLRELARIDELTGSLNRRAFYERLDTELSRAGRTGQAVTLMLCDLDQFKSINDRFGHPAGDGALQSFARVLDASVRASDHVGRVGGDEFALILVDVDERTARDVLERISEALEADPPERAGLRASFGMARYPDDGVTRDALVAVADARLYEHKRAVPHLT